MRIRSLVCTLLLAVGCMVGALAQAPIVYELTMEGRHIGYSRYTRTKGANGVTVTSETAIKVRLLGSPFDMTYRATGSYTTSGRLKRYTLDFQRGDEKVKVDCVVTAKTVRVTGTIAGKPTTKVLPWTPDTCVIEGNSMDTWAMAVARWGDKVPASLRVLAPLGGAIRTLRLERLETVRADTPQGTRICDRIGVQGEGVGIELLVARGKRDLIEMRVPDQKAVFKLAGLAALKGLGTYDVGARLFAIVNDPLPSADKLSFLKVHARIEVSGEKPTPASLQTPTQKFTGTAANGVVDGVFEINRYTYTPSHAPPLGAMPPKDPSLTRYLRAEPNIECDEPEMRALAKKLVGGATTSWDAVKRIGDWVHKNIRYAITGSGALECLRTKKGDCGPHTWLTIALCRAAGIPARITGGVLYSEALGGSFGQHYWTRVWMGQDGWVPIDTTTGEVGTLSPAHITLWNLAGLKSVNIEVLDYAPKLEPPAEAPRGETYRPKVGDSERWVFLADGKEIGEQTARCVQVGVEGDRAYSDWTYSFTIEVGTPPQKVSMLGGYSLFEDGSPRKLTFDAEVSGTRQTGTYTFTAGKVAANLKIGEMPVVRSLPVQGGVLLQMNNLISLFSLDCRSMRIRPGDARVVPFFAAATMQRVELTFKSQPELQTIRVLGEDRRCIVCDVEPIKNRFFIDSATGELWRVDIAAAKLVIERR